VAAKDQLYAVVAAVQDLLRQTASATRFSEIVAATAYASAIFGERNQPIRHFNETGPPLMAVC
jgi:hypothetical protein